MNEPVKCEAMTKYTATRYDSEPEPVFDSRLLQYIEVILSEPEVNLVLRIVNHYDKQSILKFQCDNLYEFIGYGGYYYCKSCAAQISNDNPVISKELR